MRRTFFRAVLIVAAALPAWSPVARAQPAQPAQPMMGAGPGMPDLASIVGKPLPDRGMALGTVMVRLARQTPANAIAGVEIVALVEAPGGETRKRTAKTDTGGRALFEALPVGHQFQAEVVVDGEKLTTSKFAIPEAGGVRTMLIAKLSATPGGAPAGPGAAGEGDGEGGDKQPSFSLGLIAGTAAPDPALPVGTIHVLALDEAGRPLAGHTVEVGHVKSGGQLAVTRQVTASDGTARFSGLTEGRTDSTGGTGGTGTPAGPPGADVGAAVVMQVGALRLGTDGFGLPATGGVRVEIRVPQRTADPSIITIGAGGRLILQMRDETVSFIETLPLENHSDKLFDPGVGGIEIPLPTEFTSADVAEGEHKIEIRKGIGVAVHGMIPPRRPQADPNRKSPDEVTFGFVLPATGSTRDFEQRFPNGFGEFTFITDDIPGLSIDSTQITGRQEREVGGKKYVLRRGEPVPPGGTLRFTVRGLPAPNTTGRTVAGALALALVGAAFFFGRRDKTERQSAGTSERDKLVQRRERLFADLVGLETRDTGDRTARGDLVQKLETVYREIAALDERRAV
ncbi:MAG: hypothetical protein ABUR63_01850 [Verrucomicrobiota bacterium]